MSALLAPAAAPAAPVAPAADAAVRVSGVSTDTPGRFVLSAGTRHYVSDARVTTGGPGEAVNAGELLLSALTSCALAVIQHHAHDQGWAVGRVRVEAEFTRDSDDGTRYADVVVRAALPDLDRDRAQALLDRFTATCPIYNTLRRGGPARAELVVGAVP